MAQCQPQQWTVVSDFDRITGAYRRSNIQLILRNVTAGTYKSRIIHGHNRKKLQQLLKIVTAAVFSATKNHRIRTCRLAWFQSHLSSSPGLHINSFHTAFSACANDRLSSKCGCLPAYSGGTVRDSHPVPYSPVGLLPLPQALKRNIYLWL